MCSPKRKKKKPIKTVNNVTVTNNKEIHCSGCIATEYPNKEVVKKTPVVLRY